MSSLTNLNIVAAALTLAYSTLDALNSRHGKGSLKSIAINIDGTDLTNGVVKGSVSRSTGDSRTFGLKVKPNGKVEVRFLDHKTTVSAS